jgi:Fuc2NAc and GlcNAc transferase
MVSLTLTVVAIALAAFMVVITATGALRRLALRKGLLDVPNQRSSHTAPVPRGGGVGFGLIMVCGAVIAALLVPGDRALMLSLGAWILATLMVGWVDDRHGLTPAARLAFQFAVTTSVLIVSGPLQESPVPGAFFEHVVLRALLTAVWFMWMLNLYNFMDGIDGIASVQAIVAGAVMAAWFAAVGDYPLALFALVVAASTAGFLVWNRSPARIFMGDSGSTVLGLVLAWLAFSGANRHGIPSVSFVMLLGVFIADATVTLVRRLLQGEQITQAHRGHFYQRAVALGASHRQVTGFVGGLAVILSVLATFQWRTGMMYGLWTGLAASVLVAAMITITLLERRKRQHTAP